MKRPPASGAFEAAGPNPATVVAAGCRNKRLEFVMKEVGDLHAADDHHHISCPEGASKNANGPSEPYEPEPDKGESLVCMQFSEVVQSCHKF